MDFPNYESIRRGEEEMFLTSQAGTVSQTPTPAWRTKSHAVVRNNDDQSPPLRTSRTVCVLLWTIEAIIVFSFGVASYPWLQQEQPVLQLVDSSRTASLDFEKPIPYHESQPGHSQKITDRLEQLDQRITGKVYYRKEIDNGQAQAEFDSAWHVWNQAFARMSPFAVVEASTVHDVAEIVPVLVELETLYRIPFTIKSGGHNYAGWSTVADGIVLSLRNLRSFALDLPDSNAIQDVAIATLGPGTSVGDILKHGLVEHGYSGVLGSTATVCMGGWIPGGGLGSWSRRYGLGIDNVISIEIVLADGKIVTATEENEYSDLFWALRGAGQATLGVITGYRYKQYPAIDEILVVTGKIPQQSEFVVLTQLGLAEPDLPRSMFVEVNSEEGEWTMTISCLGESELDGQAAIEAFLRGTLPRSVADRFSYDRQSWYQNSLDEAEEFKGLLVQNWNGFLNRNDCNYERLSTIVNAFQKLIGNPYVLADIELIGGAISEVDPKSSSFPWRNAIYSVGIIVSVPVATKHANFMFESMVENVDAVWRNEIAVELEGTFVNYAMKSLETDRDAYASIAWGTNLGRLMQIKAKYDPGNVFRPALSIPL
jgi:FAD/FMN-containing dehydrogenase